MRKKVETDAVSMAVSSSQGIIIIITVTRRAIRTWHLQPETDSSAAAATPETECVFCCVCVCVWTLIGRTFCQSWSKKGGHTWLHRLDWQAPGTNHRARRASDHLENSLSLSPGELQLFKLFSLYIFKWVLKFSQFHPSIIPPPFWVCPFVPHHPAYGWV